jgi:hypothetical protein
MDRTIARLNTEEIINEVNNVIKTGLEKLLVDHLCRYELLEKTHEEIMNLSSVRNHLNLPKCETIVTKDVSADLDTKYGNMIEKLLTRIDELTLEVNQLKHSYKPEHVEVVKLEQKENIKLEIEEAIVSREEEEASEEEEDDEDEEEEEEEEDDEDEEEEEEDEEDDEDEDICSECDCKVILKEDIIIVDGKKYCGACNPSTTTVANLEEEEEVETEKSESDDQNEIETEEIESEAEDKSETEEYIEIDIDDITYCTNNEENGFIYELTEDGDVGDKVGYLKDGEPFFYADEK